MGTWPKYRFRKLGFLNYWHLHHDALSSPSNLILCVCDLHYLPTNHHSCSKIISSSNNQGKWWAWKTISSPRCDECPWDGLPVQYLPNLHMNQTLMFIWLFWKGFIINPKSLNPPSMDPSNIWCECFGPIVPFFPRSILMSNIQWAMDQHIFLNPMFRFWKKISSNALLCA
jgi:hypothetical protein